MAGMYWREEGSRGNRTDIDYLLAVPDLTRMGNLRFRERGGAFLSTRGADVPSLREVHRLEQLATKLDAGRIGGEDEALARRLFIGGTSLGGMRPKITVTTPHGLAIAKFLREEDDESLLEWEAFALEVARLSNLQVPRTYLQGNRTLISHRFDRTSRGRVPYQSGHSVLRMASYDEEPPYSALLHRMRQDMRLPKADMEEMLARIGLSIAVNNVDDHSKNHGFIRRNGQWRLSPMFDINPDHRTWLTGKPLQVGTEDRSFAQLIEMAPDFGISKDTVALRLRAISEVLSDWENIARNVGVRGPEDATLLEEIFTESIKEIRKETRSSYTGISETSRPEP